MNPQSIVMAMMQKNPQLKQNPIMQNAFQMAQKGDSQGLQQLAQNVANSKGIDLNKMAADIKNQFGI